VWLSKNEKYELLINSPRIRRRIMKITDVETVKLAYPLEKPLGASKGDFYQRTSALVRVYTDEDIIGVGEGLTDPLVVEAIIEKKLKGMIIGEDPFNIEKIWKKLFAGSVYWELKGATICAISGLEVALWDIIGKTLKVPVYKLLGGNCRSENKILAYASDLFWDEPDAMAETAAKYVKQGFSIVKTHLGRGLEEDEKRVKVMREAIGDKGLMVDINCAYDRVTAYREGKMLEKYDLFWYEEPLPPYDVDGYVELKRRVNIPIATGENDFTKLSFKELFLKNAVDYAMPDINRLGGLLESKKVCALAEAFNVVCSPHNWTSGVGLAATIQLMACTPSCELLEFDPTGYPLYEPLLAKPLKVKDGYVEIPDSPGIGVNLTDKIIEKYQFKPPKKKGLTLY
jgi:L-alanine-DL-glutamate epimerase-like enolase superfamily enzyme